MSMSKLSQPFPFSAHKMRVMNVSKKGDKATAAFYIDARDVMNRLDGCGVQWSDEYETLALGKEWVIQCSLTIDGITRTDVGQGDAAKDAYSDAFKRAAVKFGIGRYLYGLETGPYLPVNQFKQFEPQSEQRLKSLLKQQLDKLGLGVPQDEPEAPEDDLSNLWDTDAIDDDNGESGPPMQGYTITLQDDSTETFEAVNQDEAAGIARERNAKSLAKVKAVA